MLDDYYDSEDNTCSGFESQGISSEDNFEVAYQDGKVYSLTVKPDDKLQFDKSTTAASRLLEFYQFYSAKCQRLFDSKHFEYNLRVEISEPIGKDVCNVPRMHLHGTFKLKTRFAVLHWLLVAMPDLLIHARLQIGELRDPEKWSLYCNKQSRYIPKNCSTISNTHNES